MSLESALDEERRAVLALLEGRTNRPANDSRRGASPVARAQSPVPSQSPMRSMLDIGDISGPTSPRHTKSMIDAVSPPGTPRGTRKHLSPGPALGRSTSAHGTAIDPESAFQFEMLPTIDSHIPKRVTQGGKKQKSATPASVYGNSPSDLLEAIKQGNVPPEVLEAIKEGRFPKPGKLGSKSRSPASRAWNGRSASPGGRLLNNNSLNLKRDPNKFMLDSGKVVDMQNAYRRLSDAALLRSGSSLAGLPLRKGSDPTKGESLAPGGGVRLEKDYYGEDDEHAVESSDEEGSEASSEGGWDSEKRRGRTRTRDKEDGDNPEKKPKSLLAAAEAERQQISNAHKPRSLLEPMVTVTGPDGEKMSTNKKAGVHPQNNFEQTPSGLSTPINSDTEAEISEIKSAQQLQLSISSIHSTPEAHRCVRQIIRGDYSKFQKEAEQGLRRQRVYLVATDLSEEAAYALEWTIGTILRDGDTLLAVYAVDEEVGTGAEATGGATAVQESARILKTLSFDNSADSFNAKPSPLHQSVNVSDVDDRPDFSTMDKGERERWQACTEVSDRCVKLLRKTRLQVRVVVEVFHCKSPKHMITEVIDFLEPTLVVLGSRGRSALKGVLLGSFSNYLVTKSSVPVMVARKRLRKHSKYRRTNMRMSNVLSTPSSKLAFAKVD